MYVDYIGTKQSKHCRDDTLKCQNSSRFGRLLFGQPSRRRSLALTNIVLLLVAMALFDLQLATVSANLIGLDFGSSFMKATLVRPGKKFAIVENTASKRKTEAMVTLGKENRLWGADSWLEGGKYPLTTFGEMFRTFGQPFDAEAIQKLKDDRLITTDILADERGLNSWKIEDSEDPMHSEEVVAMLLQYVQMLAEKQAEARVREIVLTVPSWFTYDQRLMMRDAAE